MARESRDPANDDTLLGLMRVVLNKFLQGTDDMLPAMVTAYDRATNKARVQPLIQVMDTEGGVHNRAPLSEVPVLLLGGGTFFVSFNITPGNLGWIKSNDRDISLFLQSFANNRPNTLRLHTFEDAIFIPDIMTGYNINSEDADAMVIQNTTGTVRISLNDQRIKMTAPALEINTTGATSITSSALNINTTGATSITSSALTHNGTNVGESHTHPQARDSGNNVEQDTGGPTMIRWEHQVEGLVVSLA